MSASCQEVGGRKKRISVQEETKSLTQLLWTQNLHAEGFIKEYLWLYILHGPDSNATAGVINVQLSNVQLTVLYWRLMDTEYSNK